MVRRVVLVLVAACGGSAVPTTKPVVAVKVEKKPPRTEPTCEDMGPLLRRAFAPDGAGAEIMQTIADECASKHWPESVLTCVADTPEPKANDCLAQLNGDQTESLNTIVAGFNSWDYNEGPPEPQCADVLKATDVADWTPVVVDESDRDLARALRRPAMLALCDVPWDSVTLHCLNDATDPTQLDACVQVIEPGLKQKIDDAVAHADEARKKMAKVGAASCDKMVAAHYAAAKWRGHAPTIVGGSRAKVIAASRKMMRDACIAEAWNVEVRACVAAVDEPVCWKLGKLASDEQTWSYPAEGTVPIATGVPECDDWGAEVTRAFGCQALPEDLRVSLRRSFNSAREAFDGLHRLPAETVKEAVPDIADSCRQVRDTVGQLVQKAGC